MTYTFKLARRLAVSRKFGMLAMLALVVACADESATAPNAESIAWSDAVLSVSPTKVIAEVSQPIRFRGHWLNGDANHFATPVAWSSNGGTITADGSFSSDIAGTLKVVGRGRGWKKADTAVVIVVPPVENVARLAISPQTVTLDPGTGRAFSATAYLADGSTTTIGLSWAATGGSVDAGGLYTAGTKSGNYRVVAANTAGTVADTADITIAAPVSEPLPAPAPTLASVSLTPTSASLSAGAVKQFAAYGRNSVGDSIAVTVKFAATGGTVTSTGLYTAGSTGGTFRVIARDTASGLADTSAVTITVPAPAPAPTVGLGVPYGPFALWNSTTTVKWGPEPFTAAIGASTPGGIVTQINTARAMGQKLVLFMTGGNHLNYITNGQFDFGKWKARMDSFNTATIRQAVAQAVQDGTVVGNALMDEPEHSSWGGVMTKPLLDQMAAYGKQYFPTLPMGVNHSPDGFKWRSSESYKVVDYVLNQYAWRAGSITTWINNVKTLAARDGYAVGWSVNILGGGVQDRDGQYDCTGPGQGGIGPYNPTCRTTADSLTRWGRTLAGSGGCVLLMWTFDDVYMGRSDNQAAFRSVADSAARSPKRRCTR